MDRRSFLKTSAAATGAYLFNPLDLLAMPTQRFTKADFGPDFKWGVATAAYQIEGAWNLDGKGPSVWDVYTQKRGGKNIKTRENGNVACDFYHRYEQDLELIKSLNLGVFRFSIAWSRIMPDGMGKVNKAGIEFYHKVIDKCLALGIEPWITLYHWDIPQALEDKGGWSNRMVIEWFKNYTEVVTLAYKDKVKNWMVLNEPMAFVGLGYLAGMHAPGYIAPKRFLAAAHHANMVMAEAGRIIRKNVPGANIGSTFSCSHASPKNGDPKHNAAVGRMDVMLNRLFIEPLLGMGYPDKDFAFIRKIRKFVQPGDMERITFDFDFVGLQNYTQAVIQKHVIPFVWASDVKPHKRGVAKENITEMGWEVYPEGIYKIIKQYAAYPNLPPIIITENGCAFPDTVENGRVHDERRVKFFQDYLEQILRAKREGIDIRGYYIWTFMDNFEWQEGFRPRFGIVHTNFETQERIVKDSGLWFREFLK
jgi:beta-glucosidase